MMDIPLRPGDLHLGDRVAFKIDPVNAYVVVMVSPRGAVYLKQHFCDVRWVATVLANEYDAIMRAPVTAPAPAATSVSGANCRSGAAPTPTAAPAWDVPTAGGDNAGPEVYDDSRSSLHLPIRSIARARAR